MRVAPAVMHRRQPDVLETGPRRRAALRRSALREERGALMSLTLKALWIGAMRASNMYGASVKRRAQLD